MTRPRPVRVLDTRRTQLVIVGVGGTGGYVLQQAARLIYGLKAQGAAPPPVLLIDGDTVEEKNLLRQYFLPADLGRNKAVVLADRYARAYGLEISALPEYLTDETDLTASRSQGPAWATSEDRLVEQGAVVVGCVDNASTRATLDRKLSEMPSVVYVDSGNSGVSAKLLANRRHLDRYGLAELRNEGWEGQVVAGVRVGGRQALPFVGEVLPDMLEERGLEDRNPSDPSCQLISATNPQRHLTNLMAATAVMGYLTPLLTEGCLVSHRTFFDARRGWLRSDAAIDHVLEATA